MAGPKLVVVEDEAYAEVFDRDNPNPPWYVEKLGIRGGGYTRQNYNGKPDSGDEIVMREKEWRAAVRGKKWAVELVHHEWLHLWQYGSSAIGKSITQEEYDERKAYYGHPGKNVWQHLLHAAKTGFKTNAFTRFLRWRVHPAHLDEWEAWWSERKNKPAWEGPV